MKRRLSMWVCHVWERRQIRFQIQIQIQIQIEGVGCVVWDVSSAAQEAGVGEAGTQAGTQAGGRSERSEKVKGQARGEERAGSHR